MACLTRLLDMYGRLVLAVILLTVAASNAYAETYWLDSRFDTTQARYATAQESCITGELQRRVDAYQANDTRIYRYASVNIGPDQGIGERVCRGQIQRRFYQVVSWVPVEVVDTLVYGPLGSIDPCNINSYTDPETGQCGPPKCTQGCNKAGENGSNPIHSASGNKHQREVDFIGSGAFPLRFERFYNSNRIGGNTPKPIGVGWSHNYLSRVVVMPAISGSTINRAKVYRPNGAVQSFTLSGGVWTSDPDVKEKLFVTFSGPALNDATYVTADDTIENYDQLGRLASITNRDGLTQQLLYFTGPAGGEISQNYVQAVIDPSGRRLIFNYTADRLIGLTLPNGQTITYTHVGSNLATAVFPDPSGVRTRTYHYNETGQNGGTSRSSILTGLTDETTNRFASWGYTAAGRASASVHGPFASGTIDKTTFAFNAGGTTTITDALNQSRTYGFTVQHLVAGLASMNQPCDYCDDAAQVKTYDANGYPDTETDFRGVVTEHDHNARGLETQRIEAKSAPGAPNPAEKRTIQTDWHPTFRMPVERRTYNAAGAMLLKANWTHNTRGQALTQTLTDPATSEARTTTTTYCEQPDIDTGICPLLGLVRSVNGPRTDVTDVVSYEYYQTDHQDCATTPATCAYRKGDLWKINNGIYVISMERYDGAGRVLSMKDANGITTDYEYHPRGWMTAQKMRGTDNAAESDDRITRIEYWPTGLVKKVTQPDGDFIGYEYDIAHRLTKITDRDGSFIQYTLDAMGNRESEETRDNQGVLLRKLSRDYNQLNRLLTQFDAYDRPIDFTYDNDGNIDAVTDALTRVTDSNHDALGRLQRTLQDVGGIAAETTFGYNALDHLTRVTDPKGLNTNYVYNAFGDPLQISSPDTGTTTYTYDSAGNRKTQLDARGITATYTYDRLNRLKTVAYSDGSTGTAYNYDTATLVGCVGYSAAKGRLSYITDESGQTYFCYSRFGDLSLKRQITNGASHLTSYTHTIGGRVASIKYPDNVLVDYVRDSQGRPTEIGVTPSGGSRQVLLTEATYYPFGPAAEWAYGNGRLMQRSLNQNYEPGFVEDPFAGGLSLGYEFDEVGNLKTLRNASQTDPPMRRFAYDDLNRLTESRNGSNTLLWGYGYDSTGNRTSTTINGSPTSYTYPSNSHRLSGVGGVGRSYDNAGNTTAIGGTTRQFVYGWNNRLREVKQGGVVTMNYRYNGRGEQVHRYLGSTNTSTIFDEAGHWLGDYASPTTPIRQAIWLDDLPVGVLAGSGANQKLHYIEPDALGSPRVVIDPVRDVPVWTWDLTGEAFGNIAPNQDPDIDGTQFVLDMRYPGQRYDAASGMSYNYLRDGYDAGTGRYTQSDPIGYMVVCQRMGTLTKIPRLTMTLMGKLQLQQAALFGQWELRYAQELLWELRISDRAQPAILAVHTTKTPRMLTIRLTRM